MESVLKHLQQYGWALSPPLWSHEEILLMCIITTDANLQFDGIQQKDKTNVRGSTRTPETLHSC